MYLMTTKNKKSGVAAVEYGVLAGLIAAVILGSVTAAGVNLANLFGGMGSSITAAQANPVDSYVTGGIAAPTGPLTKVNNIPSIYGPDLSTTVVGYEYANGQVYSANLPLFSGGGTVTVYNDGFTASPKDISQAAFQSYCSNTGTLPSSNSPDYAGAHFSVAANGNYVCGGGTRVAGFTLYQAINSTAADYNGGSFW